MYIILKTKLFYIILLLYKDNIRYLIMNLLHKKNESEGFINEQIVLERKVVNIQL